MIVPKAARYAVAGVAAAVIAGCMPQTQVPGQAAIADQRQCFYPTQVSRFQAVDDDTMLVFVGTDAYSLQLSGGCPDVDWALNVDLRSTGGSSWICSGQGAVLVVPSTTGPQRCFVTDIHKLTPEAAKAARSRRGS